MKTLLLFVCLGMVLIGLVSFQNKPTRPLTTARVTWADTTKIDAETGLIDDSNLMMVKAQCTACHSSKLILQHRFTRAGWQERIRWMQKYHKLWDLGESEKVVLDYLEKYYSSQSAKSKALSRRPPLKTVKWYKLD